MTRLRIAFARVQNYCALTNQNFQMIKAERDPNMVK